MDIAIVTGASSGLGRESVLLLGELLPGLDEIWVIARRKNRLEELKGHLRSVIRPLALDLSEKEGLLAFKAALEKEQPRVRFLIHAAGFGKMGLVSSSDPTCLGDMVRLNAASLTQLTAMTLPYIPRNSRIILYASGSAFMPQPGFAVYAASKAYVLSFGKALGAELKSKGIYVTTVCPGPVDTPFFDRAAPNGRPPAFKRLFLADARKVARKALRDSVMKKELSIYGAGMKIYYAVNRFLPEHLVFEFLMCPYR